MMKLDTKSQSPRKGGSSTFPNGAKSNRTSNSRPLGSIRHGSLTDSVPKFPPLPTPRGREGFDGISGSALSVPPPKPLGEKPVIERLQHLHSVEKEKAIETITRRNSSPRKVLSSSTGSARSDSSKKTDDSASKEKEMKLTKDLQQAMTREKDLKQQIMLLQKQIDELKQQVYDKDSTIKQLQDQFARQEEYYKDLYEKECSRHKETQDFLQGVKSDLAKTRQQVELQKAEYDKTVKELNNKMETSLNELRTEKDKEISIRDEKLTKLKKQMAEALKGNSWERQQQLDELSKELSKMQEECDMLKMKLRSMQKGGSKGGGASGGPCVNCDTMKLQLSASQNMLKNKDSDLEKLKTLCTKFEKQLTQQDGLIKQYAEAKGFKG